eukprot:CAMPEP_0185555928 /NCGR_PEP_ID=MMETSP1381-20130426/45783_1 /TAXON_ID=298111 /ORGANISM="Pavlova sp., Strain CCMP459" /LENGTH=36 /DNA_ID= /DNA_START= /DNA_END= /DNA_ORIENTATION=
MIGWQLLVRMQSTSMRFALRRAATCLDGGLRATYTT